ncbi:MAG TPA: acetyl-CoA hydrolase/transferase C-terminal domain-containing protein [Jiangellales bacterium]|nr:acetyl-CoA hydrolase/transferase C-terminal domain-containing protein [Jiangellales bacterium]
MRTVTPEALGAVLRALPARPRAVATGNFAAPLVLIDVLDHEVPEFSLCMLNAQPGIPTREGVVLETSFVGPGMRGRPNLAYVPSRLSLAPLLFTTTLAPDVVLLHTSLPEHGTVSLGTEVNVLPAAVEAARARGGVVVAQLNRRMPYTYGDGQLPLESIDFGIEVDEPLSAAPPLPLDDVARGIGERVASLVSDGATLQLGIGSVPDATLQALSVRRGLRVWSEMFSDGVLALDRAGSLDPDAVITSSFLLGSPELYAWVDHNPRVRVLRTEKTNDPGSIARQRGMTSVNSALQVDLFAQANASRIATRIYSGFGGQTDFIVGALHSPGGQALIALRSWHPKADCSTIVPLVDEPVTSFQHSAVVTEQGVAPIWGHTQQAQARHLIDRAAHPDVREELEEEAGALGLA